MIITDEQLLRVSSENALPNEINDILDKLNQELILSPVKGIGLAAPQIGIAKRVAIVRIPNGPNINLVNCRVEKEFDKRPFDGEGCLSFPNRFETTMRSREIVVVDNLVEPHRFIATDLLAVVISHELDHLVGKLLPDVAIKKAMIL